ncbi:MAG: hypothetical protein JO025_22960 [Verrucomicrobia bacterium]|nr:hypothetical protein [Verrucomicrobiota bacterium]
MSLTTSRSDLDAAKDRLLIPELWRILSLPGEPPTRDQLKFSSPLRTDAHPSCSFYRGCKRMRDWSTGKDYDAVDFLGEALGLKNGEAIRKFLEIAAGNAITINYTPVVQPQPKTKAERPVLLGFRKGTLAELQRIAESRKIDVRAVELAQDLGTLRIGEVCGFESWILLDESGFCAEARRISRKPYPAITTEKIKLGERKAHTLRGSRKDWPVGLLPAKEYRQSVSTFLLVEGGPDYLAALHFILLQKRTEILPVAMLGRGQGLGLKGLCSEAVEHFRCRRVRMVPHNDPDGGSYLSAVRWAKQLRSVGADVDAFLLKGLTKTDLAPIKDLNECVEISPEEARKLKELFP